MRILVIGGYGNFGKRLVRSLLAHYDHAIIVAGRTAERARKFAEAATREFNKPVEAVTLDVINDDLPGRFRALEIDIVVNASGPFHRQRDGNDYRVASACLASATHYVDLADHREFVTGFHASLDTEAKKRGLMLVAGASTVPGLTTAVIDYYLPRFSRLESVDYGISPGNRTERGEATVASILSYTGLPFTTLRHGRMQTVYGWQDLRRFDFGGALGRRWMANCNIPDLDLLPTRYPALSDIRFQAGLEVSLLHLGLWSLSLPARIGLVRDWSRWSRWLTRMSEWFRGLGSDAGGMFVRLRGTDRNDRPLGISWQLVALEGTGPNVPTISAELVIRRIARGDLVVGATPCIGLFDLDQFFHIANRWGITREERIHD